MHTNGNFPSVWASVGLAAQGSNVSYGSGLSPNYFSLFIHEIKKCILMMHICMMHLSMILDPDTCMYDAHIYDPPSLTLMHVCMMHISMILDP